MDASAILENIGANQITSITINGIIGAATEQSFGTSRFLHHSLIQYLTKGTELSVVVKGSPTSQLAGEKVTGGFGIFYYKSALDNTGMKNHK